MCNVDVRAVNKPKFNLQRKKCHQANETITEIFDFIL